MSQCSKEGCDCTEYMAKFCKNKDFKVKKKKGFKVKTKGTGELEFFREIWEERPHVCFVTGERILEFNIMCFAHVLPKGHYGKWRLNKDNIVLMSPESHWAQHNLAQSDLEDQEEGWIKFFTLQSELKLEYNEMYK